MWADSSPQSGRDWLMSMAAMCRVRKLSEAAQAVKYLVRTRPDWSDHWEALDPDLEVSASMTEQLQTNLRNHTFLPVALGSGRSKVEDKSSALLQALALECSNRAEFRDRLGRIFSWTTDMGTEMHLPLFETMSFEQLLPSWLHFSLESDLVDSDAEAAGGQAVEPQAREARVVGSILGSSSAHRSVA